MAEYRYDAVDEQGQTQHGRVEADTAEAAQAKVRERGMTPLRVERADGGAEPAPSPAAPIDPDADGDDEGGSHRTPLEGLSLIGLAIVLAVLSTFVLRGRESLQFVGWIGLAAAGMIYLAGVIRWAVLGDRTYEQNQRIIDLLEQLLARQSKREDLELLERMHSAGLISDEQYHAQRRKMTGGQ